MTLFALIFFIFLYFSDSSLTIPIPLIISHIALVVIVHILLSIGVYFDAKSKGLEQYKSYAILTACTDIIGLITYLIFTKGIKRNSNKKKTFSLILSGIIILFANITLFCFISYPAAESADINYDKYYASTLKNENGELLIGDGLKKITYEKLSE